MSPKEVHTLEAIALIYARCSCGWVYRIDDDLRGRTDEDLAIETGAAWESHRGSEK